MSDQQDLRPPTQVLTRGFDPSLSVGSARPAVFRSSTYVFPSPEAAERAFDLVAGRAQPDVGEQPDLIYSRFNHPNAEILEERVVPLETGAHAALVFNSGMAAIMTALFTFARPGQNIIYTVPIYGGTQHLIEDFLSTLGIGGIPVQAGHTGEMDDAIRSTKNLAIVLIETPANPTIVMTDIRHATDASGAPESQAPGHGGQYAARPDVPASADAGRGPEPVLGHQISFGPQRSDRRRSHRQAIPNADSTDALQAQPVRQHPAARRMLDAGRPPAHRHVAHEPIQQECRAHRDPPGEAPQDGPRVVSDAIHRSGAIEIARNQCDFPGGMLSIDLRGGKRAAFEFLRNLRIARNAVSLGGVETLVCHPKTTTHSGFTEEEFAAAGVTDGLVRISIGIEDWRDLLADFEQALDLI